MEDENKYFELDDVSELGKSSEKLKETSTFGVFKGKEVSKYSNYFLKVLKKCSDGNYKVRFLTSPVKQWVGKSMKFTKNDLEYILDKSVNWRNDSSMSDYDKAERGIYGYAPKLIEHCDDSRKLNKIQNE